jgi:hypothetical protein
MKVPLTGFGFEPLNALVRIDPIAERSNYTHVILETGACRVQAYATAAEMRQLALAAALAADAMEMLESA